MLAKLRKSIEIYNKTPKKLSPAIFIIIIYILLAVLIQLPGFNIRDRSVLVFLPVIISVILGALIDYLILKGRNEAYFHQGGQKVYIRYAYLAMVLILLIIIVLIILILKIFF